MNIEAPIRKSHIHTQYLSDVPEKIFPLLCPVEEAKWVPDWSPVSIFSDSGFIENHCVFITGKKESSDVWIVVRYEPENYFLELIKFTPDHTIGRVEITLRDGNEGRTRADIMYEYTAVGPDGMKFLEEFTEEYYQSFMRRWEKAMNYYLEHEQKISF